MSIPGLHPPGGRWGALLFSCAQQTERGQHGQHRSHQDASRSRPGENAFSEQALASRSGQRAGTNEPIFQYGRTFRTSSSVNQQGCQLSRFPAIQLLVPTRRRAPHSGSARATKRTHFSGRKLCGRKQFRMAHHRTFRPLRADSTRPSCSAKPERGSPAVLPEKGDRRSVTRLGFCDCVSLGLSS